MIIYCDVHATADFACIVLIIWGYHSPRKLITSLHPSSESSMIFSFWRLPAPSTHLHPRWRRLRQAKEHFAESGRLRNWIWQSDSLERYKCDVFCFYGKYLLYSREKQMACPESPKNKLSHVLWFIIEIWLVKTLSWSQWRPCIFFLWLFMVQSSEPNIVAWGKWEKTHAKLKYPPWN